MRASSKLGIFIIIFDDSHTYFLVWLSFGDYKFLPWQFLNFLPLPHGHGSFGRGMRSAR